MRNYDQYKDGIRFGIDQFKAMWERVTAKLGDAQPTGDRTHLLLEGIAQSMSCDAAYPLSFCAGFGEVLRIINICNGRFQVTFPKDIQSGFEIVLAELEVMQAQGDYAATVASMARGEA